MKIKPFLILTIATAILGCNKKEDKIIQKDVPTENYTSLHDFYDQNGAKSQYFYIEAQTGGSFTAEHGTHIFIRANTFTDLNSNPITGNVKIELKEIYRKSDMLLSDKPTTAEMGYPLVSAGEFFIKATLNNQPLRIDSFAIQVEQPSLGAIDSFMEPFALIRDSLNALLPNWMPVLSPVSTVPNIGFLSNTASSYVFSLFSFGYPADSGTWCNSDNPNFFVAYPQTNLTLHSNSDTSISLSDVFLVFKNQNSMVHVYQDFVNPSNHSYSYAPVGLQCTVVAIGLKNGKLFSAFVPITISNNQTVGFTLTETTTSSFRIHVESLN